MYKIDDIDIYIMTHNRAELISQTLDSLMNQSVVINNVTVLDNESVDNTENVVKVYQKKYKQINYIKTSGKYGNFLQAQELTVQNNSKYIMTLHDDDLLHPEFFEKVLMSLNSYNFRPAFVISAFTRFPTANIQNNNIADCMENPLINNALQPLTNDFIYI